MQISSEDDIFVCQKVLTSSARSIIPSTRDRWFPKICDWKLHPQTFGDDHPSWWTPIFFKLGWKSGNKPSRGKMMLISHLPWSFLLAKAVALSVQERIEGWIVDFFILCWLVPGARVFPEISWGYLQWPVLLSGFFVTPNPWGNDPILYLLAPKKKPTGLSRQVFEVILLIDIWRADLLIWIRNQGSSHLKWWWWKGNLFLQRIFSKKTWEFEKFPLHFFAWSRFLDFCHMPACCIKKTTRMAQRGSNSKNDRSPRVFFMGKFDGMRCYTLESLEIQHGCNKNDGLEEVTAFG